MPDPILKFEKPRERLRKLTWKLPCLLLHFDPLLLLTQSSRIYTIIKATPLWRTRERQVGNQALAFASLLLRWIQPALGVLRAAVGSHWVQPENAQYFLYRRPTLPAALGARRSEVIENNEGNCPFTRRHIPSLCAFSFRTAAFLPDLIGKTEYAGKQANLLWEPANSFQTTYAHNSTTRGFTQGWLYLIAAETVLALI